MEDIKAIREIEKYLSKNECNLTEILSNIKLWDSEESQSDSAIIEAKLKLPKHNTEKVIIKVSPYFYRASNNMVVEKQIYKFVQSFLINKYSPHLITYLGDYKCDDIEGLEDDKDTLTDLLKSSKNAKFNLLITIKSSGKSLDETLKTMDELEVYHIMFQMIYTLLCFEKYQLVHNDLHLRNILIEKGDYTITYFYNNKNYTLRTNYMSKIFDFNFANIPLHGIERNMIVDENPEERTNEYLGQDFLIFIERLMEYREVGYMDESIKKLFGYKPYTKAATFTLDDKLSDYMYPLNKCFENLINHILKIDKQFTIDREKMGENTYRLPDKLYVEKWFPTNIKENRIEPLEEKKIIKSLDKLISTLSKAKIFACPEMKFTYEYDTISMAKKLYQDVNKGEENGLLFCSCFLLSIPFYHSYTEYSQSFIIDELLQLIGSDKKNHNYISNYISIIWNHYNNKLPVEMPFL